MERRDVHTQSHNDRRSDTASATPLEDGFFPMAVVAATLVAPLPAARAPAPSPTELAAPLSPGLALSNQPDLARPPPPHHHGLRVHVSFPVVRLHQRRLGLGPRLLPPPPHLFQQQRRRLHPSVVRTRHCQLAPGQKRPVGAPLRSPVVLP
eukprot:scaffold14628_cov118-Isochrysis_galbana.AAC.3